MKETHDLQLELAALQQLQWQADPLASQLEDMDFGDKHNRQIFKAMQESIVDGVVDVAIANEKLNGTYKWLNAIVSSAYVGAPHQIFRRLRQLRARREAKEFESRADGEEIPVEFAAKAKEIQDMISIQQDTTEEIVEAIKKGVERIPTGFSKIDWLCKGGIPRGGIMAIGAQEGTGKTALAINMAKNFVADGRGVCFATLEMSKEAIATRFLQSFWGETEERIKTHVDDAVEPLRRFHPIEPSHDIDKIVSAMMGFLECDVFMLDYLDLIDSTDREGRTQRLEMISHKLKHFAFENNKVLIVLSQLNKDLDKSASNREPVKSDLYGTGALSKDAHIVSFLWDKNAKDAASNDADSMLEKGSKDTSKDLRWLVKKNRGGLNGGVPLDFDGETMTFSEVEDTTFKI